MLTKCVYFKITPPKTLRFWGGWFFFGLKCRKFDSGTQVFCWTFFRHKHTYSNTPHHQKSICTHHRHKNRFQNFQKMAILAPKRCSNTAAKSVAFARLFKRKTNFPERCSMSLYYHFTMFWHKFKSWKCLEHNGSTFIVSARSWKFKLCAQICRNRPFSSP